MSNIIVVGGGIIGLSSAWYLQKSGHSVTVIDKSDLNDNCSFGNMGYVCPSHFVPLASPGIIKQGLKWMLNSRSPFFVQPSLNPALLKWGLNFWRSATAAKVASAAEPLRDIALISLHEYQMWAKEPDFEFAFTFNGLLELFQTEKNAIHAEHLVHTAYQLGLEAVLLNASDVQALEPQTKVNALGAILFKCDGHLYPNKLMLALRDKLKQAGATIIGNEQVTSFEKKNKVVTRVITHKAVYDCDELVIATGSWSREMAALVNIKLPLMPGRGYSFTLSNSPYSLNYPAVLMEGRVAVTPFSSSAIRFGGTMEVVPVNTPPRYQRVEGIISAVKRFYPEFDIPFPAKQDIWYGYRPCSADGLPYLGRINTFKNVVVATGHSMLGLSLGAGTGKLVSQIVNETETSMDLSPFAVERFK
jgi:D-amino-acid dehydrogenase